MSLLNNQEIQILDNDTVSLRFYVSEADEDDLSGFQSVCEVRIQFEHRQLSDVTMTLTSPLGLDVTLVGPALPNGTQAIGPPFTVSHDLTFIPSPSNFVAPDPGLQDRWTNNIPFWHTRSQYGGSYYASNGDLSVEHEVGPVLGIWELTVVDHFLNSEGRITGFEIVFCDEDGVVCNSCEADAGSFAVQDTQFICRNGGIDLNSIYTDGPTQIGEYNEVFLVYGSNGEPALISESPDFSVLEEDTYTVYGFSILSEQADTVVQGFNNVSEQVWLDSVEATGGFLCMDLSDPIKVQVTEPTVVNLPAQNVCPGDPIFMFNGLAITESGLYIDTLDGCNSIERIGVTVSNLTATFDQTTILTNCNSGIVIFGPSVSGAAGTVTYEWSQAGGGVISTDSALVIATAADWSLVVRDDICSRTLNVRSEVAGVGFQTMAIADPPQFNCVQDSITLSHNSNFLVDSIKWFREGRLISESLDDIRVGQEGEYSVEVYGSGCLLADDITLTTDMSIPQASVVAPVIDCSDAGVLVSFNTTSTIGESIWINSTGDTISRSPEIAIDMPGMYELILIGQNLCDTVISFEVMSDAELPAIDNVMSGDLTLTCDNRSIEINPTVDDSNIIDDYWIFGVDDTIRDQRNITITEANAYRYQVVGSNGCIAARRLDVSLDTVAPSFVLIPDTLTCGTNQATILLTGLLPNVIADFSGANVLSQTDSSAIVDAVGIVSIAITDQINQCVSETSFDVSQDLNIPDITLSGDSLITCATPNASLVASFNNGLPSSFYWISPLGDSTFERSVVVRDTGLYMFEAIGTNGCDYRRTWQVGEELGLPVINVPSSYISTCAVPEVRLSIDNFQDIDQALWIIEGDTFDTPDLNIMTTSNSVELILIGLNGCSTGQVIDILYDTIMPPFSLEADVLDCATDQVTISTDEILDHHTFVWAGAGVANEATPTVNVVEPGAYALNATDTLTGCSGLMTIDVMSNYELPSFLTLPLDTITCNRTSVNISLSTSIDNVISWDSQSGSQVDGPSFLVQNSGFQSFTVRGPNGCFVRDSIEVLDDLSKPRFDIEDTYVISCNEEEFLLSPDYIDPVSAVTWFYKGGVKSTNLTEIVNDDSLDSLEVAGLNGCTNVVSFDISVSNDKPNSVINPVDSLLCFGETVAISTGPLASPNHRAIWFRDEVLVDTDVTSVPATETGAYILQVIDTVSGCQSIDTFDIVVSATPFQGFDIDVQDETCMDAVDGVIAINDIIGGVGVLTISLDGEEVGIETITDVVPDIYDLLVVDDLGCMIDTMLSIGQGGQISVEIGENIRVERGEKVTIIPEVTGDAAVSVMWTGDQGTMSDQMDSLCFVPIVDEKILVSATGPSGCIAVDSLLITVFVDITKIRAYVPNILVRESDMGNDQIEITLSPDILEISDFAIYDRWGQQVMFVPLISNGETVVAWDGRFNNQPVSQGVYIYSYEMITIHDDRPVVRTGDITIIN